MAGATSSSPGRAWCSPCFTAGKTKTAASRVFDVLGIAYVGSGVTACALAMDKQLSKTVFRAANIPDTPDIVCGRQDDPAAIADQALKTFGGECVVKPTTQGSALGLSFCATEIRFAVGLI